MPAQAQDGPVARAEALAPLVREAADEAERERRLPARVAEAMAREGLYRVAAPKAFGGGECDPWTQIRTIEAVARADGSAGWNLMIGIESFGLLALGFERGVELFADPMVVVCGSTAAAGRAERAEGGFRVSGRWQFVSGCHNSHFFSALVAVHSNGGPDPTEPPRFAVLPRDDVEILDTWNVGGLRGSGSHDVRVDGVFVPAENTTGFLAKAQPAALASALNRIPNGSRLAYNKVGVSLGIARAAIDAFVDLAAGKLPRFSSKTLRERPFAQEAVAIAEARLRGARALLREVVDELYEDALAERAIDLRRRALVQIACSDAVRACAEVVDRVAEAAGTSANFLESPLERPVRDVRVVRQHATVAPHHLEDAGRVLLGLDPEGFMLNIPG